MAEEKKYKVIALSVGGARNKVYKSGDIVTAESFPPGNAEKLVATGFIIPVAIEKAISTSLVDTITAKELKEMLSKLSISFGKNESKVDLYATLMAYLVEAGIDFDESISTKEDLLKLI